MGVMSKQQFGFRADDQLAESIKSYKQANNLSQSVALRRLVQKGLRADEIENQVEELRERVEQLEQEQSGGLLSLFS